MTIDPRALRPMLWIAVAAALALCGCGAGRKHAEGASDRTSATNETAAAGRDAAPVEIVALADEKLIYECPKCGMMYRGAGACTMDGDTLVATRVDYTCPADGQPVAHAGQCPRCPMNARVEKTAVAAGAPAGR